MAHRGKRGDRSDSPLAVAAGAAGPRTTEAFAILGNETRLAILLALWEAFEPWADENAVSFTELRDRVGIEQGRQFTYHLDKLTGEFVRKTDGGYELRRLGHLLVQTIIAGTGVEDHTLAPTGIDLACYLCGAPTAVTYFDGVLFWVCTECDGLCKSDDVPTGTLAGASLDPAGFADRSPEELLNAAWTGGMLQPGVGEVCDACSGPMDGWLHVCDDHVADEICPNCGWRFAAVARFRCSVCKRHHQFVPSCLVINHPAVVAFYYDRGVPLQYEVGVDFNPQFELNLQGRHDQELVSEDPPLVRVTIQHGGDELQLTIDGELNVVDVDEAESRVGTGRCSHGRD